MDQQQLKQQIEEAITGGQAPGGAQAAPGATFGGGFNWQMVAFILKVVADLVAGQASQGSQQQGQP